MNPVEQIVWLVETRLGQALSVADVAAETGLSRFIITRLFADAAGSTLSAYLRGRRLSEAARMLAASDTDILPVANAAGYASHEAFTRAFRRQFGVNPELVRQSRDVSTLKLVEPIRMNAPQRVPFGTPEITDLPSARYVGLTRSYAIDAISGIPGQWQHFMPHLAGLDRSKVGGAFGIVRNASPNGETLAYSCAVRDGAGLEAQGELETVILPAMRLAKFTLKGHVSAIRAATMSIFAHELPRLGLRPAGPFDMIEFYGPAFDPMTGFGEIGLWIHIG